MNLVSERWQINGSPFEILFQIEQLLRKEVKLEPSRCFDCSQLVSDVLRLLCDVSLLELLQAHRLFEDQNFMMPALRFLNYYLSFIDELHLDYPRIHLK